MTENSDKGSLEERLEEAQSKVANLRKDKEQLEMYSRTLSHELKTPLTVVIGSLSMLKEFHSSTLTEEAKRLLDNSLRNASYMSSIISDVQYVSRLAPENVSSDEVNLSEIVQGIATELQSSNLQRHVNFEIAKNVVVYGDKIALKILMSNLLGNAYKYSERTSDPVIEFGIRQENSTPVYFIKDNGTGFDQTNADKLFEPFQRLHGGEYEGTGLGLFIAKKIIDLHGGTIRAEGKEGEGATFYFTLPKHQS